jgi:hypothetical protein
LYFFVYTAGGCPNGVVSETIANGQGERKFGDGTSIGTIYEYTCNAGYEFVGQPYVICKDDATWSQNGAPTCRRKIFFLRTYCNFQQNVM